MALVKASLLFRLTNVRADGIELEAHNIADVIATFMGLAGDEVRQYFFLENGQLNGATFVIINGKLFNIDQALKIPLKDRDSVSFGQFIDGG